MASGDRHSDFLDLAGSGDFCDVAAALRQDPSLVHARAEYGDSTPLMQAVFNDNVDIAELLLDHGAKIDAVDVECETALMWAAKMASRNCARLLLERGADWRQKSARGETAFDIARHLRSTDIAEMIDRHIAAEKEDAAREKSFRKPIDIAVAAAKGQAGELRAILADYPESVHWQEPVTGATALRNAVAYGELAVEDAALLIAKGADVNAQDKGGWTPLMFAAQGGKSGAFLDLLLDNAADPLLRNSDGQTAAAIAAAEGSPDLDRLLRYTVDTEAERSCNGTDAPVAVTKPLKLKGLRL